MHIHLAGYAVYIGLHTFIVCLAVVCIAVWAGCQFWGSEVTPDYFETRDLDTKPSLRVGRPGRVNLRVAAKPVPDDRDSIQQFKRRVN